MIAQLAATKRSPELREQPAHLAVPLASLCRSDAGLPAQHLPHPAPTAKVSTSMFSSVSSCVLCRAIVDCEWIGCVCVRVGGRKGWHG
jgi:hypothetical protein